MAVRFLARSSRARVRATFSLESAGFEDIDLKGALRRAQEKNAEIALREVKDKAAHRVKGRHPMQTQSRRHPDKMEDRYEVLIDPNGDLHLYNPLLRAKLFELGSPVHNISAGGSPGRVSPVGYQGAATKNRKTLTFWDTRKGHWVNRYSVPRHPGQEPNPVMQDTIDENMNVFANNILDELDKEF